MSLVLDWSNYASKKELEHARDDDISGLPRKRFLLH